MPKDNVSLTKDSKGRYVVQDMKNFDENNSDVKLMIKPESDTKSGDKENWYTPDFIKIKFAKDKKK